MSQGRRDGAKRLLAIATLGLPTNRSEWGAAMRAELASIDEPRARRDFARSSSLVAFKSGLGIYVGCGLLAGTLVAAITVTASRMQLANGGPGLLPVTVPIPALLLLLLALLSATLTRSFRFGLQTGAVALVVGFVALFAVLATEGMVWMDRRGVFILDGDPPKGAVDAQAVVFDVFATGMWLGHAIVWVFAVVIGAALGALLGGQRSPDLRNRPTQAG